MNNKTINTNEEFKRKLAKYYPTKVELSCPLENYYADGTILKSDEAIKLTLSINSNLYDINDIRKELNLIYLKLLGYFN